MPTIFAVGGRKWFALRLKSQMFARYLELSAGHGVKLLSAPFQPTALSIAYASSPSGRLLRLVRGNAMDLRRELNRKIERKRAEIAEWTREKNEREALIREGHAYIAGLTETLKLLPKETPATAAMTLRPDSEVAKSRLAILKAGAPLHVDELLKAIGKPINHNNKASLSGSLSTYVRKGQIFTRPAPNTFGLIELEQDSSQETPFEEERSPDFGSKNGGAAGLAAAESEKEHVSDS
jgi:hypothetical protein